MAKIVDKKRRSTLDGRESNFPAATGGEIFFDEGRRKKARRAAPRTQRDKGTEMVSQQGSRGASATSPLGNSLGKRGR